MRAGLNTIQQTLTPEAANVLNHSIAEATRRNHGQTTPLHVAATLLSSPTGYLRQACIKSHPNSSHPLQCRALELCFSVALERLPTAQNLSPGHDPPISNALMAALKRAQAHQRRGCPEQQQQPLLAVKVELEQLIISILDDPSVSRVMREASFSSPAVKATIEQSLSSNSTSTASSAVGAAGISNSGSFGFGFRTHGSLVPVPMPGPTVNQNLYVNPRLQQQGSVAQSGQQRNEEVKRVVDILLKNKKRNPVLVGESEPELVVKELLKKIESQEFGDGLLMNVHVIHLDKDFIDKTQMTTKIMELGSLIETKIANLDSGGVILDLGDLKWLVEQPVSFPATGGVQQQQQTISEAGRAAVSEMGKLLARFGERTNGKVWLIGTATCETYLRCQVYHPSMENDWDLQAVPIAPRAPLPGMFPRFGSNGILGNSIEPLSPLKGLTTVTPPPMRRLTENLDPARRTSCCPQCMQNYEQELAKLTAKESNKSSPDLKSDTTQPTLPQWLKNAKPQDGESKSLDQAATKDQELMLKQKTVELQKQWHDTCVRLHPGYHQPSIGSERITQPTAPLTSLYNPNLLARQPFQPKLGLNRNLGGIPLVNPKLLANSQLNAQLKATAGTPQLNAQLNTTVGIAQLPNQSPGQAVTPPGSPVRTDLVLGRPKSKENTPDRAQDERTKDFLGAVASEPQPQPQPKLTESQAIKLLTALDANSFKRLIKGLLEKVWWQREAASAVATTITQCRMGNGKQRSNSSKGDIWLLFSGPDRVGKKKMASALSDLVCGASPTIISLGARRDDRHTEVNFRGKTAVDRLVEAVRRNPFSVIMLEDIDEADMLIRGSIKRAMERGRLSDSHGREISLGNVIFILTANWLPDNLKFLSKGSPINETKLADLVSGDWQLRLSLCEKTAKRRASWLHNEDRHSKPRKESGSGLAFDLNEAAVVAEDDKADGSRNSSDVTVDHEDDHVLNNRLMMSTTASVSKEFLKSVEDNIVFKSVDLASLRSEISTVITKRFSTIVNEGFSGFSFEMQDDALDKIAAGLWLSRGSLEEWTEKTLVPSIRQLKLHLATFSEESNIVRLEPDNDSGSRDEGDWLPSSVRVAIDVL